MSALSLRVIARYATSKRLICWQQARQLSSKKQGNFFADENENKKAPTIAKVKLYPGYQQSIEDRYLATSDSSANSGMYN